MYSMRKLPIADAAITPPPLDARPFGEGIATGEPGGLVGAMQADLAARLTVEEYERWLLPPEPREGMEKLVHWLSLGAGVIALTGGAGLLWLIL